MRHPGRRIAAALLLLLAFAAGFAVAIEKELKVDGANNHRVLRTRFGTYGYRPRQALSFDPEGLRFRLPGVTGTSQTGIYSFFVLAGDCEVTLTYEIVDLPTPKKGYGSSVGLAFDAGDEVGRGTIQRIERTKHGSGYALRSTLVGRGDKGQDEERFVPTAAKKGRFGLQRIKKELVFLASDDPKVEGKEVGRLPFTDGTIRTVRLFADPGGVPTAIDVRLKQVQIRGTEITGGVPKSERRTSRWWWLLLVVPALGAVGLLLWRWRVRSEE